VCSSDLHDFTHRTHAAIFGFQYPRSLPDWSSDDWVTYVYSAFGLQSKLEAADFRAALNAAEPRQTAAGRAAAAAAAAEAAAKWTPLVGQDEAVRSQAFGLFFGLPGRCEHAARRLRDNITTPPATPAEVGLE
jgi:hypothetical protein